MNVEIGAEATLFPEKKYINGIAIAVFLPLKRGHTLWVKLGLNNCFFSKI
jgi:hypothetical protein